KRRRSSACPRRRMLGGWPCLPRVLPYGRWDRGSAVIVLDFLDRIPWLPGRHFRKIANVTGHNEGRNRRNEERSLDVGDGLGQDRRCETPQDDNQGCRHGHS